MDGGRYVCGGIKHHRHGKTNRRHTDENVLIKRLKTYTDI
jgi:hypothetical protein